MRKAWIVAPIVALVLVVAVAGVVMAQSATPQAPNGTQEPGKGFGLGGFGGWFGFGRGNNWAEFDAVAKALNMSPDDLFTELHSGKTLAQIAQEKGVDLSSVQKTLQADRVQAMKDAINQAVQSGRITKEQGDWLTQGLDKGWLGGAGRFGPGFGYGRGMGRMPRRGFGGNQQQPQAQPTPNA